MDSYTYNTAEEARAVAEQLGLSDVHEVEKMGMLMFRPGSTDAELREAIGSGGSSGAGMMSSSGAGFGFDDSEMMPMMDDSDDEDDDSGMFGLM
jgi:hypothetical protein